MKLLFKTILSFVFCASYADINFDRVNILKTEHAPMQAYILYIPSQSSGDDWQNFQLCAYDFSQILNNAAHENVPVVMVIPNNYKVVKTTGEEAPLLEGTRVALAWATAYSMFTELGNVDVRVLVAPADYVWTEDIFNQALQGILQKNIVEIDFKNRLFKLQDVLEGDNIKEKKLSLNPYDYNKPQEETIVIRPDLSSYISPMQRIVIAGGAGFIGSHLTCELLNLGHQVIVLDNLFCSDKSNIQQFLSHKNFDFYEIDIAKPFDIEGPIDIVINLASVPSPYFYYRRPLETLTTGLYGVKNTLELAQRKNARYFFSSTSEVYGDPEISPQPESYVGRVNPIGKRSQYDQSKRGAETLMMLFFKRYTMDIRIARIFNTYGPGMLLYDGRVVTNFIKALLDNKPMTIYGSGNQTRSFCYIDDLVDGLLRILFLDDIKPNSSIDERIFNVGNPDEFTINELAQKMQLIAKKLLLQDINVCHIKNPDEDDPKIRKPDISRIKTIGFEPHISLDTGLEKTFMYFFDK